MEIKDILKLIEAVSAHGLTSFELEENGSRLSLKKEAALSEQTAVTGAEAGTAAAMASAAMASATMANATMANAAMANTAMANAAAAPLVAGAAPIAGLAVSGIAAGGSLQAAGSAQDMSAAGLPGANADGAIDSDKIVTSPLVGTFYDSPSPDADSFVKVGDHVKKGQVLGIIEAMKLMNEIESEFDGVVEAVLVKAEDVVEYGQPLFRIR